MPRIIVYHGTSKEFAPQDLRSGMSRYGDECVYFTPFLDVAMKYGNHIISAEIDVDGAEGSDPDAPISWHNDGSLYGLTELCVRDMDRVNIIGTSENLTVDDYLAVRNANPSARKHYHPPFTPQDAIKRGMQNDIYKTIAESGHPPAYHPPIYDDNASIDNRNDSNIANIVYHRTDTPETPPSGDINPPSRPLRRTGTFNTRNVGGLNVILR